MSVYEIAVIGAGKTGRGFIGRLLQESGLPFALIDQNAALVDALNAGGGFEIGFFGGARCPMLVDNYVSAYTGSEAAIEILQGVKLVFISVGGGNLAETGRWLAKAFEKRLMEGELQCSFITCENANKPAEKLKAAFLAALNQETAEKAAALYGFSEATVFCTTIEDEKQPLNILSEDYPRLQCDAVPLKANLPKINGLQPIQGFENFLVRKLYTYNAASAAICYLGWLKGYQSYADAANDEEILGILNSLYAEVGKALCSVYGYDEADQREFAALSLGKFCDRAIQDTIERNAREPHRKLAGNERIIGPARLIRECGGDSTPLEITAAAALLYANPSDAAWTELKERLGSEGILSEVCGLSLQSPLAIAILHWHNLLRDKYSVK